MKSNVHYCSGMAAPHHVDESKRSLIEFPFMVYGFCYGMPSSVDETQSERNPFVHTKDGH